MAMLARKAERSLVVAILGVLLKSIAPIAMNKALAIDPNAKPEWRLENIIMQTRARWLLSRAGDLILGAPPPNTFDFWR